MADDAVHPDLWAKVAALDQRCRLSITRDAESGASVWVVTISHSSDSVVAQHHSLARALTAAILAAELRGWF